MISNPAMAAQPSTKVPASSNGQPETPNRIPAPYGQSCINCVKAKCRCMLINHTGSGAGRGSRSDCERCSRLGKECKPSNSSRKRGAAAHRRTVGLSASGGVSNRSAVASKTADLEQKLEDLMAMLQARTPSQPNDDGSTIIDTGVNASSLGVDQRSNRMPGGVVPGGPITPASTAYATCSTADSTPSPLSAQDALTSVAEAEDLLQFFRQHHLPFFPFMYMPPSTTAAELQRDRPFTWLNIKAICCKSPVRQFHLSQQIRDELAHKSMVSCERDIDLLLGTLVLLGWSMFHSCGKPKLNMTMGVAMSVVADLRLDKVIHDPDPRGIDCFKSTVKMPIYPSSTVRTMEERRATLACYVFCSITGAFLNSLSMRWTPHMEDSLRVLSSNPEWEGDQMLALMVRIRKLAEDINQSQQSWALECDGNSKYAAKPPVDVYTKHYHLCVRTIRDQLPESLKENKIATSLLLSAEMLVSELPFAPFQPLYQHAEPNFEGNGQPPRPQFHTSSRLTELARAEANYATMQVSKRVFEQFLTFETPDCLGFSFPILLNFFRAAQVLYRLRVVDGINSDSPANDTSGVIGGGVGLIEGVELMANRFEQLSDLYGFHAETDAEGSEATSFYAKCSKLFSGTLPMWRAHFAQAEAAKMAACTGTTSSGTDTGPATTDLGVDTGNAMNAPQTVPPFPAYPGYNSNYPLSDMLSMDFHMDEAWGNELMLSFDTSALFNGQ
ncbi:hypothetical protein F4808DRAFT_272778 [Astrocystis sublimbata]|nr:hypothetical protein F4808DRAFT_272778 [Astrocystis sublimbata]